MCGRYAFISPSDVFLKSLLLSERYQNYNIAPGQIAPIILQQDAIIWQNARWGLLPSWLKKLEDFKAKTINARAESLREKPSFKLSFEQRRCIVPATGFFEWRKSDRQPYFIKAKKGIFAFAGLYDIWKNAEQEIYSFSIITTRANDSMAEIHERMPAILNESDFELWLNPKIGSDRVDDLLLPYKEELIKYAVDRRVGRVTENDVALLEPISLPEQGSLF